MCLVAKGERGTSRQVSRELSQAKKISIIRAAAPCTFELFLRHLASHTLTTLPPL